MDMSYETEEGKKIGQMVSRLTTKLTNAVGEITMNNVINMTKWKAEHGVEIPDAELRNYIQNVSSLALLREVLGEMRKEYYNYKLVSICQEVSDATREDI